jgi:predicted ATPase
MALEDDLLAFQHWVGIAQRLAEVEAAAGEGDFTLLDKSLVDAVAYWNVYVGGAAPTWAPEVGRYSLVVVCEPGDISRAADQLQEAHWNVRAAVHAHCVAVGSEGGLRVVVAQGSVQERSTMVLKEISSIVPEVARAMSSLKE